MKLTKTGRNSKERSYKELKMDLLNDLSDPRHGVSKVCAFSYNCQCEKCRNLINTLKVEIAADKNHKMHGTTNCYVYLGCRCTKCTRKFHKKVYGDRREGNWNRIGIKNFTWVMFLDMLAAQDNKCCVCGESVSITGELEHNHETGKIRGITCHKCNHGIRAIERLQSLKHLSYERQIQINHYLKQRN